ncbi:MAG: type II toxin-antitoxin system RelE/ParE family toxin [Chloroflexaceae bacterium]|nr:type II toxin-antitoxin system RelE/ParE family toxin [Chloroflexaceae bacterium]
MTTVIFHPQAQKELADAATYYEKQQPGLGQEYLKAVENAVNLLIQYPEAGLVLQDSIRRLLLPKFSYYLVYRLSQDNHLRILAIAHHKRKPKY